MATSRISGRRLPMCGTKSVLAITLQHVTCPDCTSSYYLVLCSEHRTIKKSLMSLEAAQALVTHMNDHLHPVSSPGTGQEGVASPAR